MAADGPLASPVDRFARIVPDDASEGPSSPGEFDEESTALLAGLVVTA